MSLVAVKYVLAGGRAGFTGQLGKYNFEDGVCEVICPQHEVELHARSLERNYQAFPLGDDRLEAFGVDESGIQEPEQPKESLVVGDDADDVNTKLKAAVLSLDPHNDDHWTKLGKPSIEAVVSKYGSADVTRAAVEAVAPGYNREQAAAQAEGGDAPAKTGDAEQ